MCILIIKIVCSEIIVGEKMLSSNWCNSRQNELGKVWNWPVALGGISSHQLKSDQMMNWPRSDKTELNIF